MCRSSQRWDYRLPWDAGPCVGCTRPAEVRHKRPCKVCDAVLVLFTAAGEGSLESQPSQYLVGKLTRADSSLSIMAIIVPSD